MSLALHVNALSLLTLADLKHDLSTHEQRAASSEQERPTTKTANNIADHRFQAIHTDGKTNQIGSHHHENVASGTNTTDPAIDIRTVLPLLGREKKSAKDLWQDEQRNQPAPNEQLEVDIVPKCDKSKDSQEIADSADLALSTATDRDVNVPDDPAVETPVPAAPEGKCRIVVTHAADHVLRRINTVCE